MRRALGSGAVYGLWLLPPVAALVSLFPAAAEFAAAGLIPGSLAHGAAALPIASLGLVAAAAAAPALGLWAAGALASATVVAVRERRFRRAARDGAAGPAVVGLFRQRVAWPRDAARRFTPDERDLIAAHERAHIRRGDPVANLAAAAVAAAAWFNPSAPALVRAFRADQEAACDAEVLGALAVSPRAYGAALLRAQIGDAPAIACTWSTAAGRALANRIRALACPRPGPVRRGLTRVVTAVLGLAIAGAVWTLPPLAGG